MNIKKLVSDKLLSTFVYFWNVLDINVPKVLGLLSGHSKIK